MGAVAFIESRSLGPLLGGAAAAESGDMRAAYRGPLRFECAAKKDPVLSGEAGSCRFSEHQRGREGSKMNGWMN